MGGEVGWVSVEEEKVTREEDEEEASARLLSHIGALWTPPPKSTHLSNSHLGASLYRVNKKRE
jgi:hypothetical protein